MIYRIRRFSFFETSTSESYSSNTINGKPVRAKLSKESYNNDNGHITSKRIVRKYVPKR